jgi:hypothetical protein
METKTYGCCPICGKPFDKWIGNNDLEKFGLAPRTTLFGKFKKYYVNEDGNIDKNWIAVNRRLNVPVCSKECKQKNEEQYIEQVYNGSKIFCVDGWYSAYLESNCWYDCSDTVKHRIDNPNMASIVYGNKYCPWKDM